jgi:hypothetical protein
VDYETACRLLINQSDATQLSEDTFLARLRQGKPPVPGQVTSILLALKVVLEELKGRTSFERPLANALFLLAYDGRRLFDVGLRRSLECPPLLNEDLERIAIAVKTIFSGV